MARGSLGPVPTLQSRLRARGYWEEAWGWAESLAVGWEAGLRASWNSMWQPWDYQPLSLIRTCSLLCWGVCVCAHTRVHAC